MHSATLTGEPLRTYQSLVENSSPRRVSWSDVRALLEAVAEVTVQAPGTLTATRNGHVLTLHPALTKDIAESGEVKALRRFLQDLETEPVGAARRDPHLLLVIQGPEAKLYRCQVIGGVPRLVLPYEPSRPDGDQPPARAKAPAIAPDGNFAAWAEELQAAGQIVIFGAGTDSDAATFGAWLNQHDSELGGRIIANVRVDERALDEAGLLRAAREVYAALPARGGRP